MREELQKIIEKEVPDGDFKIDVPEVRGYGHFATNAAFLVAKKKGKNPHEVAEELKERILKNDSKNFLRSIEVAGPGFLNFRFSDRAIQKEFKKIHNAGPKWGKSRGEKKKTIVIDYSHPNIAKPMSVAHLRSTIIGQALYNLFSFLGWKAIGDNHLGDWGKQFGVLIAAFKEKDLKARDVTIDDLMKLYVDYTARMKENEHLENNARKETKKLQDGDRDNVRLWRLFYRASLQEFKKAYATLGVKFDYYLGESYYKDMLPAIVAESLRKGFAKRSEGAVIISLDEENLPPFLIQKSDGAFLYSTTDLAAVRYRVKTFKPDVILYVVDNAQSLHFEQLFASVKKLGYVKDEYLVHAKFGLMLGSDLKKLSTRAGKHVALDKVLEEAIERAKNVIEEKQPDLGTRTKNVIATHVGVAALKYNDLSQNRTGDIIFDWDRMLNLEGNSAPYLQYSYARLKSILRKAGMRRNVCDEKYLNDEIEHDLVLKLSEFPHVLQVSAQTYAPHHIATYLYELAQMANAFYQKIPVLKAEAGVREARLCLVYTVAQTLKTGLNLLGIRELERM